MILLQLEVELAVLAAGLVSACTVVVAEGVLVAHVAKGSAGIGVKQKTL